MSQSTIDTNRQMHPLEIHAIRAFQDNYIWLLTAGGKTCAVVDPGDAAPVLAELEKRQLDLRYILLTSGRQNTL